MHRTNDLLLLFFLFYYSLWGFFLLLPFFSLPLSQERKGGKNVLYFKVNG